MGGFKFRRQHALGRYIADFVCIAARLVIEVDGETHASDEKEVLDAKRAENIERLGYRVIRFWNNSVLTETASVAEAIMNALDAVEPAEAPHPDPLP